MKIVDGNSLRALAHAVENAGQVGGPADLKGAVKTLGTGPVDTAEVSGLAGKLAEAAAGGSPERAAKVEALRAAAAAGGYSVDGAAVARGIVADGLVGGPPDAGLPETDG